MVSQVRGNCKAFRIIRERDRTTTPASQARPYLGLWLNLGTRKVIESGDEGVF